MIVRKFGFIRSKRSILNKTIKNYDNNLYILLFYGVMSDQPALTADIYGHSLSKFLPLFVVGAGYQNKSTERH